MESSQPTEAPLPLRHDSPPVNYLVRLEDLLALARHWFNLIHDYHEIRFYYGQSGGWRTIADAQYELDRIGKLIGEEAMQKVSEEVRSERRKEMGEELWEVYQHGDDEARARVAEEWYSQVSREDKGVPPDRPPLGGSQMDPDIARTFRELTGEDPEGPPPNSPRQVRTERVNYPMSRDDLLVLAEHWSTVRAVAEEGSFIQGQEETYGRHVRRASRAIDRLLEVLGTEAMEKLWEQSRLTMRRRLGETLWEIHESNDTGAWELVAAETYANAEYCDGKLANVALKERAMDYLKSKPSGLFVDDDGDVWSLVDVARKPDDSTPEDNRLALMLVTRAKGSVLDPTSRVEQPADWVTPTWGGRWWCS